MRNKSRNHIFTLFLLRFIYTNTTVALRMNLRRKLTREIEKQEVKISQMRSDLVAAEAYLKAQQDVLKLLPREPHQREAHQLRVNSDLAKAREIIAEEGKPIHVSELLKRLGKELTRDSRASLSASIGAYVRRNEIFTRPAPNTFGLVVFNGAQEADPEPPEGFGIDEEKAEM